MLSEDIIRIGRPIVSGDLSNEQRIRWLTDVDNEVCKNFFQHVFLIEIFADHADFHFLEIGNDEGEDFQVDKTRNAAFPIIYPNGGNPLHAQGIYPVPVFLMYEKHINDMNKEKEFASKVVLPRLKKTVIYKNESDERLECIAQQVAALLKENYDSFIEDEKQLGILYICDLNSPSFKSLSGNNLDKKLLRITESKLFPSSHLYLDGDIALEGIIEARFSEAKELGYKKKAISTITNKQEEEVVSIYNKSWLWLSPTWEMPKPIHWEKNDWINGIKVDKKSYEAFLYGAQFLKQITAPISNAILKEMFAPYMNVEAKRKMKSTSFEQIYGVPLVVPLLDGDSQQLYKKYSRILNQENLTDADLHLEILAGINRIIPRFSDEHRLNLLYYSGDLSRGNMHVRLMLTDIIPSVAEKLQTLIKEINTIDLFDIRAFFNLSQDRTFYRVQSLPSIISNAFGQGYTWSTLQSIFHQQPLGINRVYEATARKLAELANKEDYWGMMDELVFHFVFLAFYNKYSLRIAQNKERVKTLNGWNLLLDKYREGKIFLEDLLEVEQLGFVTGLLLKQFSHSYHFKTGHDDFLKHRVIKFGSKITPEMIWKSGILICEPLKLQWNMNLASNFEKVLPYVLQAFIEADNKKLLINEKDKFMTAFWSGYLVYKKEQKEEGNESGN
ncbi:hypothetical protein PNH38_07360 [Anoxybacillus rupiensis]|uniref:Uncharacterized protein n=1 Tax=Anoxybacteroides rupiense TaxID=311460 RepID=A0ABT5W309_9BACL|nr:MULTISPECIES: hypothetical protein [Anoxybacillus]MBS2772775.1 hypothetical protein [Anoxybacillus rupiensis]MDE8563702.1 hypothetical protein [Anoxybacillus rupiensis]QHC04472.1 hypothetical protein GRQ40_11250 [Anoxybacillus sp. PDR2]